MTNVVKRLHPALFAALLASLAACQQREGPVEQAGKEVDRATEKVGQQLEKAGARVQDAARGDKK